MTTKSKKKVTTLIGELMTYFHSVGSTNMEIQLKENSEEYEIHFFSNFKKESTTRVGRLEKFLHYGRAPEIEESYWGLTGVGDLQDENELILIGAMVDSADILITENTATITLIRKKDPN